MASSSEAAGDKAKARAEYGEFVEAWKDSDADMPEMTHAREYLAGEKVMASVGAR
jgi:hypothetical protein